jgi:hypothetical protein
VGGLWRLAARATAASLVGEAVRRLSRQCGVRCEEGLLELRRWAGEIILKAIAVPGLFLLMCRLYCTATRVPFVEVVGLRRRLPRRVGACGVHAGEGVCGVCAEEVAEGLVPCLSVLRLSDALARRLGWGFVGVSLRVLRL